MRRLTRRLTRRRQVKKKSKHSRNNKYKKTRRGKYIKKRRSVTRRRVLSGGVDVDVQGIIDAIANSRADRFKLLVDGLENNPEILDNSNLQNHYKYMIELSNNGTPTGYIGLTGLKFLNYLWARIKKLIESSKTTTGVINQDVLQKYTNLQTAISLMDQFALAPGVTCEQLNRIQELAPNSYYYKCYKYLFEFLCVMMDVPKRGIPLSTSACHSSITCGTGNDSCDSDGECCSPTGSPTT